MKILIAPLAVLGLCAWAGAASAASPAYCTLYAKEYARQAMAASQGSPSETHVHDRAYSKCLNMDDEPPLPTAYVDPEQDGITVPQGQSDVGGPFVPLDASAGNSTVAADEPAEAKRAGKYVGSGLPVGSPEWVSWCRQHYPNSFDPVSGTVVPSSTGVRTACN